MTEPRTWRATKFNGSTTDASEGSRYFSSRSSHTISRPVERPSRLRLGTEETMSPLPIGGIQWRPSPAWAPSNLTTGNHRSKLTILPMQLRVSFWTVKSNGPLESEIQPSILPELSPRTGNNLTQILRLQDSVRRINNSGGALTPSRGPTTSTSEGLGNRKTKETRSTLLEEQRKEMPTFWRAATVTPC